MRFVSLLAGLSAMSSIVAVQAQEASSGNPSDAAVTVMQPVMVTATRLPRANEEITGTVSVITDEQIQQQIANDLGDVVRYQPGVSMDAASRGGNEGLSIRGIGGNRVLTLIDGVRSSDIYDGFASSFGGELYEIEDLKSVEIIRGPASVLYGADAMGGAVLLHTKAPADYLAPGESYHVALRAAAAGADDSVKLGVTGALQQGDWGVLAQYTWREFGELEVNGDGKNDPQDGESDALLLKAVWTPSEQHRLTMTLDALKKTIDTRLDSTVEASPSVFASNGTDDSERYRVSLSHMWQLNSLIVDQLENTIYWQQSENNQHTVQQRNSYSFGVMRPPFSTPAMRVSDYEFNQDVIGLNSQWVKNAITGSVEHALVYGLTIEQTDTERPRNRYEVETSSGDITYDIVPYPFGTPESYPNKAFPDTETTRRGIYLQDEMALGASGFTVIPGIRYDYYKMDADKTGVEDTEELGYPVESVSEGRGSVNLGVIYDLNDEIALYGQYSEGFRPPNYDEANQSYINYSFGYAIVPNPDLDPETSKGVEFGVKATTGRALANFALYYNKYDDFIESQFVGVQDGFQVYQDRNISEARIYGAELSGTWLISNGWTARAAIAYSRGDNQETDTPLDSVDPLSGVLGFAYSQNDRWGVEAVLTAVDSKDRVSSDDHVTNSGYGVVDLMAYYNAGDSATLRLGVFNLLDKQYASWNSIKRLNATETVAIARAQAPGTEFRASAEYRF